MTEVETVRAVLAAVARRVDVAGRLDRTPSDDLLTAIAGTAVVALEAQAASIAVLDGGSRRLVFRAAAGPAAGGVVGLSIDAAAGIAGYAFASGQPLAVADAPSDPRFDRSVAEATGYVPSTLLATPLLDDAGTVGVLEALDRRGGSFTLHDLDIATAIAREATIAVRAGEQQRDVTMLLASSLRAVAADASLDPASVESLVTTALGELDADDDAGLWPLADRIARLRDVDPAAIELATEWLDSLLRHAAPRRSLGR
jgi:GAF domain-containing protein